MASLVTKEVEALRAVTDGQNLNSEQVGYLTRLANTEFGREVFLGKSQFEPQFVYDARTNPQPAQTPQPAPAQESAAQQEAQTAPLPPAALATMPVGAIRVPSFFSPRSAPVSFDDAIDINNLPENISSDQLRQALNQKAGDPAFELTESQNITRMRLNKKAGDEIDRAFIAANQAIPGLASLIGGAAKEWFLTTTGQPLGAAVADYVVTRMRAQDMRKQGPKSEADAAALEVQAQNQIAEYGDARLREAATLGESVRKSHINTRSLWNWARQFNDGMMSEGRKRDMLRDNLTANGILRNPEQELLSPDQRRSMQMENEIILQREWEARKAGETEDPALDAASEDEEYRRQHAAYVQNKALDRANLGIARFNRGGQEVEERADIRFADPVRFPSPFTDRLITPMENTATLGSIALDPLNAAGGVLGATTKWRLIHRTASVLGKPLTGIEKGAAGIRAAMEARREARIIGLAGRLGMKVDDARFAYDRSTRGLLNVATGGGVAGFGLGYLMSKDENFNQMGDALMVGGAILPALRGAGFVIRNTPKVAGVGGIIMQEAKAGPMGDISRIARNSTNHAEVIRAARPASAQELLQSGVVPPQYARHLRTYTDRAGDLNMAGGAARGADSTLKRVAQNPSNPENVRRFARLADQAGATGLVRALDDVASGTVAAGIGIAPFVAIAPEPEQAGSMIGGALAFGGAGGFIGGRASRAAEAFDVDVARTMVDLNAQGADVGTLFSLPRQSLEKIVNIQATAANKGVDLVLLRDEDYRANLPDVSQGTHMQRAGNVKHAVQEGDTLDALARRYYGTGEAWSRIVAANEGKIVENGGLPVGVELDMPGDNRWRMFVNMGHYSLEGGTVRVAKQADGTARVSVMKDDGTSAYDFQTPNPEGLRVKDGQKVSAYEPLTNKIDRSLTAMHEFGHEVMRSDMFDGDHRIELRAIVQQIYGADGVQVRKRDYAARLVDREIESGVSEGVEFEFANEQERRDVRDGRVTISQLRRQRGQQVKSRQELIDEKVAELEQDSVDRTGSPDAWIQDEIVNETLASEVNALELSRIRRGDNPEFFSARVGEAINTMTGRLLEFFGVKLNRSTGKPLDTPSTIFRENPLMKDPVLRKRLLEYVRDYDRYLVGLEDAGSANAKGARMAKSDRAEDFGNSPLVTLHPDPKTGRMENAFLFRGEDGKFYFKDQRDIDAAYKLQREQIRNMVRAQGSRKVPVGSGVFGMRTDDAGRTFVGGAKLPNEFDSMIHVPEHLRKFARALEEGATTGKSWIIQNHFVGSSDSGSYKLSRVRAGGRTIPREAVFINWKVTGADNILGVFLDLDAFRAATMKAINNNELPVFNNDIGVVQQKLLQLMDNHRNGRSGAAGLDASPDVAIEMKNALNGLIGTGTAVQRSTDAFTSLNPRGSIRTYRLDRIDSVKPTGRTGLHADYDKINQNKMPDAEPVDGPNNNRMPSALPQSGMAMPDAPANLSTDQILRELEENQGYLGLSTLGMREGRPVKGGAQQTRELLKRNTALNEELRRRGGPQEESDVARVLRQRGQAMPDVGAFDEDAGAYLIAAGDGESLPVYQQADKRGKPAVDGTGKAKFVPIDYDLLHGPGITKYTGPGPEDTTKPNYKGLAYDITQKGQREIDAAIDSGAVDNAANRVVEFTVEAMKNREIAAGKGWYSRMRDKLLSAFGEKGRELFAQLLGATSAKTPVEPNFLQAFDAFEGINAGRYDRHRKAYLDMLEAEDGNNLTAVIVERGYTNKVRAVADSLSKEARKLKGKKKAEVLFKAGKLRDLAKKPAWQWTRKDRFDITILAEDILPLRSNGKKFNSNSHAVLKVIAGTWLNNRKSPKTPNFAGNLTGRTLQATIDVWAARHLRELLYGSSTEPWRIQPRSEVGVNPQDFALGQIIMQRAAKKLDMNPDDLQAILWFAEKNKWDANGWTGTEGANKSSFDTTFDRAFPSGQKPLTFQEVSKILSEEE